MTSTRIEALAERFEAASGEVRQALVNATDEQMRCMCPDEACTVAALACHIAAVHRLVTDWIQGVVRGEGLPDVTLDDVNRLNEGAFRRDAACSRDEVLRQLSVHAELAADSLRGLDDAQLDAAAPFTLYGGATVSVQTLVERILIGDPIGHLGSIRDALARSH